MQKILSPPKRAHVKILACRDFWTSRQPETSVAITGHVARNCSISANSKMCMSHTQWSFYKPAMEAAHDVVVYSLPGGLDSWHMATKCIGTVNKFSGD